MRSSLLPKGLVVVCLIAGAAAFARKPQEFRELPQSAAEQRQAAKAQSKYALDAFGQPELPNQGQSTPWLAIGMGVIAFLVAAPFAIRAFRSTSQEIGSGKAFGAHSERRDE